ncbi:MAG: hypothetical protein ACKO0X_00205, partial [Bacteroidota bacterium]
RTSKWSRRSSSTPAGAVSWKRLREEKQRNLHVSLEEAATLLDFPVRKVQQLIQEGHLKQSKDGSVSRYHVVRVLFELKQAELFNSIG